MNYFCLPLFPLLKSSILAYSEQRTINGTVNSAYANAFLDLLNDRTYQYTFFFLAESKYRGHSSTFPVSVWKQSHSREFYNIII